MAGQCDILREARTGGRTSDFMEFAYLMRGSR